MNIKYNKNIALSGDLSELFYYISKAEENLKYAKYYSDNINIIYKIHEIDNTIKNIKNEINFLFAKLEETYNIGAKVTEEKDQEGE